MMTFAKSLALALALVGAVALGIVIGPRVTDRDVASVDMKPSAAQSSPAAANTDTAPRDVRRPTSTPSSRATATAKKTMTPATFAGATARSVPAAAPALHERLKPLLNKGADMGIAAEDFSEAADFAAVAHAARNTNVPFMVLKHRVVYEGKTLEDAIRELMPDLNAKVEAERARAEAKSDISALEG